MRFALALATAALAALAIASANPAAAQGSFNKIRDLCPDLSSTQIKDAIPGLVEQYEFSTDPDQAATQVAGLLCGRAEAAQAQAQQANVVQNAAIMPPPQINVPRLRFDQNLPHFNGPKPYFAPPPRGTMYPPRRYADPNCPPPRRRVSSMANGYRGPSQERIVNGGEVQPVRERTTHEPQRPDRYRCLYTGPNAIPPGPDGFNSWCGGNSPR